MAKLALLVALLVSVLAPLCSATPAFSEKAVVARQNAPEPKNGTIELHHNPDTSTWYLLVALNPSNYTDTYGNKTINGTHNPLSTVTLFFNVTSAPTPGNSNITDYTIWSTPVAFEHHIVDNLTSVTVYNAANQYYPEGQPIFFDMTVNGVPAGAVSGGPVGVTATGFTADLNQPLNITGIFTIHY